MIVAMLTLTATAQSSAPANMTGYRGKNGQTFTFNVTGKKDGRIWGGQNNIYTDDSNVATAAVHAGLVKVGETKRVTVKVLADQGSYPSITRCGITSTKYGAWHGAYKLIEASQPTTAQSSAPANMTGYRGKNGQTFTFNVTGKKDGRIWGGQRNIYTDDSDLATAVVHAGIIKAGQTGEVRVTILADQGSYPSITRNGISSTSYGAWKGAYRIQRAVRRHSH